MMYYDPTLQISTAPEHLEHLEVLQCSCAN